MSYSTTVINSGSYYLGKLLAVLLFLEIVPNPLNLHILLVTGDDLILDFRTSILGFSLLYLPTFPSWSSPPACAVDSRQHQRST